MRKIRTKHIVLLMSLFSLIGAQSNYHFLSTNSESAKQSFSEGIKNLREGEPVKAASDFESALKSDGKFALAAFYRWKTGIGGFESSEKYKMIFEENISSASEYEKSLIELVNAGEEGDGIEDYKIIKMLSNYGHDSQFLYQLGQYFLQKGNLTEATDYLDKCARSDKDNVFWSAMYGMALSETGNPEYAGKLVNKYSQKFPESPFGFWLKGKFEMQKGDYPAAESAFESSLEKDKSYLSAYKSLAGIYLVQGNFSKASDAYQSMFDFSKDITLRLEALRLLADCSVYASDYHKALRIATIGEKLAEKYGLKKEEADCHNHKGYISIHMGQVENGMKEFEKAERVVKVSSLPEELKRRYSIEASINRCYALIARNMLTEAGEEAETCRKMLAVNSQPDLEQKLNGKLALLALCEGNTDKAGDLLSKSKLDYYNLTQFATVYNSLGDIDQAKKMSNLAEKKRLISSSRDISLTN